MACERLIYLQKCNKEKLPVVVFFFFLVGGNRTNIVSCTHSGFENRQSNDDGIFVSCLTLMVHCPNGDTYQGLPSTMNEPKANCRSRFATLFAQNSCEQKMDARPTNPIQIETLLHNQIIIIIIQFNTI